MAYKKLIGASAIELTTEEKETILLALRNELNEGPDPDYCDEIEALIKKLEKK